MSYFDLLDVVIHLPQEQSGRSVPVPRGALCPSTVLLLCIQAQVKDHPQREPPWSPSKVVTS